jgi:hypothetical protein
MTIRRTSCTVTDASGKSSNWEARFAYDPDQPYEVRMDLIRPGEDDVIWTFSRDVLARNLTGLHDVRCDVDGLWTYIHLSRITDAESASATVRILRAQVDAFLRATARCVPYGRESVDFDAELDQLLKDGAR